MRGALMCIFGLLFIMSANAQTAQQQADNKNKAVFIYNFTKHISWPASYKSGNFVVGVVGKGAPITIELKKMLANRTVGRQPIIVQEFATVNNITKCHILFIPNTASAQLPNALQKLGKATSTLVITEKDGLINQGACINFVKKGYKIAFEMHKTNILNRGLRLDAGLDPMAVLVVK